MACTVRLREGETSEDLVRRFKSTEDTPVVLELSSWQLADLRGRKELRPYISLITKIVPDHQNWYGNMEDYVADKRLIYKDQDKGCYTIVDMDADEPGTGPSSGGSWGNLFAKETKGTVLRYTRKNWSRQTSDSLYLLLNNTSIRVWV